MRKAAGKKGAELGERPESEVRLAVILGIDEETADEADDDDEAVDDVRPLARWTGREAA